MTTPIARFIKGTYTLNLQSGRYQLGRDFEPPPYAAVPLLASGTSANKSGATKVDETPVNRSFSFSVNITGGSSAEIRRGLSDLQSCLSMAGDENEPLYFAFYPNSDAPEPLWGNYGAWIRYEIVSGTVSTAQYMFGARLNTDIDVRIDLILKPHAVGLRQRLASAMGGIIEDNYGARDKKSRGLIVPEATTNLFTNPVFGNSVYSTNWTVGSNLTAAQNTSEKFVLPGCLNSMRVYARNSTNNTVTASLTLTVASYTITALVMLPDLTAPSSTQLQIYYNGAAQTTTYEAVGENGLYRCYAVVTGVASPLATGVLVKNKYTVYLLGIQCELKAYPTPLCYGDLLGCSWSGTAHASTSTRAVGRVLLPIADDTYFRHQGTIAVTVKFSVANTHPNDMRLFFTNVVGFQLYFSAGSDVFSFYDGANDAVSSAQTFSPGAIYTLHCVWSPSGLALYVNGAANGSDATFTPVATGSHLYIGSNSTPANNTLATFMDFRVYENPLTATEVANDYANLLQLTADNQRVGCIPWLWTKDGDDVVDNCYDSTRDNWAVCGGIPGSAEAVTRFSLTESNVADLILSNYYTDYANFARPGLTNGTGFFHDAGGTAGAGTDSNSDYKLTSVTFSTSAVLTGSNGMFSSGQALQRIMPELFGREFFVVCRLYDEGSNFSGLALSVQYGSSGQSFVYPFWAITTTAANRLYLSQYGVVFPAVKDRDVSYFDFILILLGIRSSGTANIRLDWAMAIPRPFCVIDSDTISTTLILKGLNGKWQTTTVATTLAAIVGDAINLFPEKANMLISIMGSSSADPVIAWTLTYSRIDVTPRYELL